MKDLEHTRRKKNPTTNYPKDSHKEFCKRCYEYNKGCPDMNSKHKSPTCSL